MLMQTNISLSIQVTFNLQKDFTFRQAYIAQRAPLELYGWTKTPHNNIANSLLEKTLSVLGLDKT